MIGFGERIYMNQDQDFDVAVIIVGLNARDYVKDSIASVLSSDWGQYSPEVIYIDNGSSDGSAEMVEQTYPEVHLIANPDNLGFCIAANQGARIARSRYYFFLNDDTLVRPDAIPLLVRHLDAHSELGAAGSRLLNTDGTDQWSGRRYPTKWNAIFGRRSWLSRWFPNMPALTDYLYRKEIEHGEPFIADWVSAAAMLVRKDVFWAVGGFAEDYYYWHEAVICDRIRRAGHEIVLHPQSKIMHYEGKGSGPRPYPVQRWHIIDFHRGAFRSYCEHYDLGGGHPLRLCVGGALAMRALSLLLLTRFRTWLT